MVLRVKISGTNNIITSLNGMSKEIPRAGRNMTRNLAHYASRRAKFYANKFSASGTLSKSIRPSKTIKGYQVIVQSPSSAYAGVMEDGFKKKMFVPLDKVSPAGYTLRDWAEAKGLDISPNQKYLMVGSGKGVPKSGYKYMENAFRDSLRKAPSVIRKELKGLGK